MKLHTTKAKFSVVWQTESSGYVAETDGIKHPFVIHKWDAFPATISIKANGKWENNSSEKAASNPRFAAIHKQHIAQFIRNCSRLGYDLRHQKTAEGRLVFTVSQSAQILGTISQGFDMWFSGDARFNPKRFAHIQDCLEDLRARFEGRQAKG